MANLARHLLPSRSSTGYISEHCTLIQACHDRSLTIPLLADQAIASQCGVGIRKVAIATLKRLKIVRNVNLQWQSQHI